MSTDSEGFAVGEERGDDFIEKRFRHQHRDCRVVYNQHDEYAGYARTSLRFSYHKARYGANQNYYEIFDVHGGLTFGVSENGWVGFRCDHPGDEPVHPDEEKSDFEGEADTVWTQEMVVEETRRLAEQLTMVEEFLGSAVDD